jgi:hypothetical protein
MIIHYDSFTKLHIHDKDLNTNDKALHVWFFRGVLELKYADG